MDTFFDFILYFFILLLTGLLALKPRFFWDNIDKWYSDDEPSEFRTDMIRIVCAVMFFIFLIWGIAQLF
ncbi:DUF6199 family natural product biosynthesis protein [Brevibacillus migulae]|uniref:DUF6199 family natural product biosynthesis protein n=1 Tax=Brevibacillus migulae TaxID=1644114 RepID=UPI00106EAE98|nr:DUF6199 family natural product biosynthesis protein [Brevibacillus migulae]